MLPTNAGNIYFFLAFKFINLKVPCTKEQLFFLVYRKLNVVVYYCQYMYTLVRYALGSRSIG